MSAARTLSVLSACLLALVACQKKQGDAPAKQEPPANDQMRPRVNPRERPREEPRRRVARPVKRAAVAVKNIEVKIPVKDLTLEGTLSVPAAKPGTKRPAFLLVHGSGPQSRDVKVAGVAVFAEIAKGLTAKGAVVLRYDKRAFTLRNQFLALKDKAKKKAFIKRFADMSPDHFIADARAAFDFLAKRPEVDPADITVVGHSQGGSFGPDIVRGTSARRLILLAPGMQPYDKMLVDQLEFQAKYLGKMQGTEDVVKKTKKLLVVTKKALGMLRDRKVKEDQMIMGASKKFHLRWIELTKDMVGKLAAVKIPTLIIQGDKDLKCLVHVLRKLKPKIEKNPKVRVAIVENMIHELLIYRVGAFDEQVVKLMWEHRSQK